MQARAASWDDIVAAAPADSADRGGTVPYVLLLAFIVLLYLHPGLLYPPLAAAQPTLLVGVLAIGSAFGARLLRGDPIVLPWPEGYGLVALLAVAAVSSFTALWPRHAVHNTMDLVRIVAIFFVVVNVVDTRKRLWGLLLTFVAAGMIPAVGALTGIGVREPDALGRAGWVGNYANPNDLAFNLIALVPIALAVGSVGRVRERLLAWPALAIYLAAIFFSYSRGGFLGLLAVLGLAAFLERGIWPRALATIGIVVAVVFASSFWARDQGFSNLADDPTVMQRFVTIEVGLTMWTDRPLIGVGPGCSILGWPLYAPREATMSGTWLHNHNTPVQVLSETGLLGFLTLFLAVGASLLHSWRLRREAFWRSDKKLERVAGALHLSLWAFLICGLAAGLFLSWIPYLVMGMVCVLVRIDRDEAQDAQTLPDPRAR